MQYCSRRWTSIRRPHSSRSVMPSVTAERRSVISLADGQLKEATVTLVSHVSESATNSVKSSGQSKRSTEPIEGGRIILTIYTLESRLTLLSAPVAEDNSSGATKRIARWEHIVMVVSEQEEKTCRSGRWSADRSIGRKCLRRDSRDGTFSGNVPQFCGKIPRTHGMPIRSSLPEGFYVASSRMTGSQMSALCGSVLHVAKGLDHYM